MTTASRPARPQRPQVVSSRHALESLADALWSQRHIVEHLLYKLLTARLMLAAGERRFADVALEEVERVVGILREAEQRRAAALERVAVALGVPSSMLTLGELAARAPSPLRTVFRDHRDAFASMAAEIHDHSRANRQLAGGALGQGVFALLDEAAVAIRAGDPAAPTDAIAAMRQVSAWQARIGTNPNRVDSARPRSQDVLHTIREELAEVEDVDLTEAIMDLQTQQVAYEATLRALAKTLPPSLVSFLG